MENLKFRRQFLFSAKKCNQLAGWKEEKIGRYNLYVHPENEINRLKNDDMDIILIGHFINPHFPDKSNLEILADILACKSINDISTCLYSLVGRFVLIIKRNDNFIFFHDSCGLKSIFYTKQDEEFYAASQPLLLKKIVNVKKGKKYYDYTESKYKKSDLEHWIPSGSSLYENVFHLVPNYYLDVSKFEQIRYWPTKQLKVKNLEESVEEFSNILKNTMEAAKKRFKIALPITAGWDSRIILSACKDIADDIYFYTFIYRELNKKSTDIAIPKKILSKLGYKHHILDCNRSLDENFADLYVKNSDMAHLNDWGFIANGMIKEFPQEKTTIKGNCSEIGRCVYYDLIEINPDISSSKGFLNLGTDGWEEIVFVKSQIKKWFDEIKNENINLGYNLLDLFYWEQRMGSWQAQAQLEWDIVHDSFTPFNNREIIDIMLAVDSQYRKKPNYLFFTKVIEQLWEELLEEPINPKPFSLKFRIIMRKILIKIRVFKLIKKSIGR